MVGDTDVLNGDVEANAEGGEIIEARQEDVEQRRVLPTPQLPSQSEVDDHNADHTPSKELVPALCGRLRP